MGASDSPTLRVDPELARMSIGLQLASLLRVWIVGRSITSSQSGSGKISKKELKAVLRRFDVVYTRQYLNYLLRAGEDFFWNTSQHHLYVRSSQYVAKQVTQRACQEHPDLLSNKAGVTDVLLSPAGSLEQWEATIYAGWLAHRDDPTISREILSKLFNRSADTLRRWESEHLAETVTKRKNYAQCDSVKTWDTIRPAYSQTYIAKTSTGYKTRICWQLPNTYKTKGIKIHRHRGQAQKVRKAVNYELQQPANHWRGGFARCSLYFDSVKRLRSYLKKHPGTYYLWRGKNKHQQGIFEATSTGWSETTATERASFRIERKLEKNRGNPIRL